MNINPLEYTLVDGGIHHFRFNVADRKTTDEFMDQVETIMRNVEKNDCILLIIDLRPKGLPPVSYTLGKLRELFKKFDDVPKIYGAYLYNQSLIMTLVSTFMQTLRTGGTRKMFLGNDEDRKEDEAIEWLLQMRAEYRDRISI